MNNESNGKRDIITLPARDIPVIDRTDVLVVGGGPSGIGAALAAARSGAKTTLVEHQGFLGGLWTAGMLNPILDHREKGGIVQEILDRLKQDGKFTPRSRFDNEYMKYFLECLLLGAGVDLRMYRLCVDVISEGEQVRGIVTESKSGTEAFLAKTVIDCTGDGDVCAQAGVPFSKGREDGLMQSMTLFFMLSNVKFSQKGTYHVYDLLKEASEKYDLNYHIPYRQPSFFDVPLEDHAVVQLTHMNGYDGTNADDLTAAAIEGRKQTHEAVNVMTNYIPELKGVELVATAPHVGVRESRHIQGRYQLKEGDLLDGRQFDDGICWVRFNIDIHGPELSPTSGTIEIEGKRVKPYQIPYRSLLPANRENLLMAGQCISGTSRAHSSFRVTGDCVAMGQAAGTAAAMAVKEGTAPSQLDAKLLVRQLQDDGVKI